jgi:hypothetical protein
LRVIARSQTSCTRSSASAALRVKVIAKRRNLGSTLTRSRLNSFDSAAGRIALPKETFRIGILFVRSKYTPVDMKHLALGLQVGRGREEHILPHP